MSTLTRSRLGLFMVAFGLLLLFCSQADIRNSKQVYRGSIQFKSARPFKVELEEKYNQDTVSLRTTITCSRIKNCKSTGTYEWILPPGVQLSKGNLKGTFQGLAELDLEITGLLPTVNQNIFLKIDGAFGGQTTLWSSHSELTKEHEIYGRSHNERAFFIKALAPMAQSNFKKIFF